jgi:hypothetical protein
MSYFSHVNRVLCSFSSFRYMIYKMNTGKKLAIIWEFRQYNKLQKTI